MSVKSGELENRQIQGGPEAEEALARMRGRSKPEPAPADDAALRARIEAARQLAPPRDGIPHCGCCWGRGRDAAIRAITGEQG